jgi:hypothetical protein
MQAIQIWPQYTCLSSAVAWKMVGQARQSPIDPDSSRDQ